MGEDHICKRLESSCGIFPMQRLADFQRKIDRKPLENTNNKTMEEFKV